LQIQEVCNSTLWETAKQQLLQKSDGRYFAINSKHLAFPGPGERATEGTVRRLESAGAEISRAGGPLESVIYHEQQIRDEQE
ncbi:hypothetical protein ACSLNR_29325, partial [Escherichia coli]